jgi:peptidoglycan/xylan/chitin deacetylase (PgdA/CDA1 family)
MIKELKILTYHRIIDIDDKFKFHRNVVSASPIDFDKQIKYVSNNFDIITFEKLDKILTGLEKPVKKPLIITFDDGYKDNFENAFPILKKYNVPATFFLTTGYINNQFVPWWDTLAVIVNNTKIKKFSHPLIGTFDLGKKSQKYVATDKLRSYIKTMNNEKRDKFITSLSKKLNVAITKDITKGLFLSWNDIKKMSRENMEFGSHTVSHCNLNQVSLKKSRYEIFSSTNQIKSKIKKRPIVFCYPYGTNRQINNSVVNIIKENNFKFAVTTNEGTNKINNDSNYFLLKRINIQNTDSLTKFKMKTNSTIINSYSLIMRGLRK